MMASNPEHRNSGRRLNGRRIIITGAASGIGRAMAELFREEGSAVVIFDRDAEAAQLVAEGIGGIAIQLDLIDAGAIAPAVEEAAAQMGGIDGLINCAALGVATSLADTDPELLQRFMAINLAAPYLLCRAAMPHLLRAADQGIGPSIVNVASGQALLPNAPNNTAYAATKGGLVAFTKSLAAEVAPKIRANVICPGMTNTPMTEPLTRGYANPSDAPWVKQYALQRIADPLEIARAALFLMSEDASFVTGVALAVDGGRSFH